MKKAIAFAVVFALITASAFAAVPGIGNGLFANAKEAVSLLSYGEFDRVVAILPFSGSAPSAAEWQSFAQNFSSLGSGTVQREVSVAYWTGNSWNLAVPVLAPDSDKVEALVLTSDDGLGFSGYKYARWGEVRMGYENADYVIWNKEYVPANPTLFAG